MDRTPRERAKKKNIEIPRPVMNGIRFWGLSTAVRIRSESPLHQGSRRPALRVQRRHSAVILHSRSAQYRPRTGSTTCHFSRGAYVFQVRRRRHVGPAYGDLYQILGLPDLLILLRRCFFVALRTFFVPRVFFFLFFFISGHGLN
jgi:hypothetical protein